MLNYGQFLDCYILSMAIGKVYSANLHQFSQPEGEYTQFHVKMQRISQENDIINSWPCMNTTENFTQFTVTLGNHFVVRTRH